MEMLLDLGSMPGSLDTWRQVAVASALRATIALAVAFLASAGLGRASASLRHLVWTLALAGTLVIPGLTFGLPPWSVPVLPGTRPPAPAGDADARTAVAHEAITSATPADLAASGTRMTRPIGDPGRRDVEPIMRPVPEVKRLAASWAFWIAAAWGMGVVCVLAPVPGGLAAVRRIAHRCAITRDETLLELARHLAGSLRGRRGVRILRGDTSSSPMTWGLLRPVILLPAGAEAWPRERLRAVLLHELAHVTRWDCLTQMLARLACAVYWFHPLVWLAARRLRVESERACDDMVLQAGTCATEYAAHLVDVARAFRSTPGLATAAVSMARPLQLEARIRAILDPSRSHRSVNRRGAGLLIALAAAVVLPLSTARLAARDEPKTVAPTTQNRSGRSERMQVAGRVLDPDGKPAPGAKVVILARRKLAALTARSADQHAVLGRGEAGGDGRFLLEVPRTSSLTHYELYALASRPGFALGWAEMNRDALAPAADVRLRPEQLIEARLVDLQGAPAAGATVQVTGMGVPAQDGGRYDGVYFPRGLIEGLDGIWPSSMTSDADGWIHLAGIGRGVTVSLKLAGPKLAHQSLGIENNASNGPKRTTLAVQPAMRVWGRAICADTGAPLAGALVVVGSGKDLFSKGSDESRTGADGRYESLPHSGKFVSVTVYPPAGSPYLIFERNFEGEEGAARARST